MIRRPALPRLLGAVFLVGPLFRLGHGLSQPAGGGRRGDTAGMPTDSD